MAAAAVAQNNAPSPHSSNSASPQSPTTRLAAPSNAPLYTQEDVVRFVQAALAAAYRDQTVVTQSRAQQTQMLQEEQKIMKPRVHMYETYGLKRSMIATLELPGLQKNDVSITARPNGDLIISGERRPSHLLYLQAAQQQQDSEEGEVKEEEKEVKGRTVFNELKFGKFQRIIRLPSGTDPATITASMDDGMLTICWPLPSNPSTSEQRIKPETTEDDAEMDDVDARHSTVRSA
ncbi:HSP20-like chaperone [Fomitiporia mediterranea MF3/22]|uniref:HSP20-like chaperone n=1 Tax=Fomitiporia mediterranea (strain MF3/22) TaxID=694068 RepID=UPI0004408302|nr:HSP20-like chaperone [Fomitiporia mediterranea MF3/22]EJD02051.1 HSP20-like chaperone [Fomitiporia mediterranea MF3/22]